MYSYTLKANFQWISKQYGKNTEKKYNTATLFATIKQQLKTLNLFKSMQLKNLPRFLLKMVTFWYNKYIIIKRLIKNPDKKDLRSYEF